MTLEIIKNRRSIRKYKPTPVSDEQVKALLEAAMLAPSACNTRPWRFVVITNREKLDGLAELHPYAKMLKTAALCIAVIALPKTQERDDDLPQGFWPQDCGAATQNILLQAEAMGLGSCWCGLYPKDKTQSAVGNALSVPADEVPFCLIAIGEKDEDPKQRGFYDEERVAWVR
ncbi:MAG: nitroreductase family protein [Defluviitaleaceae bacterium]|nr:nitroreductase family protein [Defluviitaleaceae bacterium]MCL2264233.1 nitroreductase family protein [Defluviitaleaceae bacterium]